ncbi:MAG: Uma2 family endonuclease [Sciscionella sp.]
MAAPLAEHAEFDPLREFYGMWTTGLAEQYLPVKWVPPAKYECVGGYLVMSPREGSANSWAALRLGAILDNPARSAGHCAYSALNVEFTQGSWIEPDLTVLRQPVRGLTWVSAHSVLMPVEFVSPSSRRRDRIDKPALCAEAGIPWYLRVEIDGGARSIELHLLELQEGNYLPRATAVGGQPFTTERPFPLSFDPVDLLEP